MKVTMEEYWPKIGMLIMLLGLGFALYFSWLIIYDQTHPNERFYRQERSQLKSIKRAQEKGNFRKLLRVMNFSENPKVRQAAVTALGGIGDMRAVRSLSKRMQKDESLLVRLACYSSIEQLTGHPVEQEAERLIKFTVSKLKDLYSRQREERYGHWGKGGEWYVSSNPRDMGWVSNDTDEWIYDGTRMVPDPDYSAIREMIELMPLSLRKRVDPLISDEQLLEFMDDPDGYSKRLNERAVGREHA